MKVTDGNGNLLGELTLFHPHDNKLYKNLYHGFEYHLTASFEGQTCMEFQIIPEPMKGRPPYG